MIEQSARNARKISLGIQTWMHSACACLVLLILCLHGSGAEAAADAGPADIRCLALTIYFEARGEPDLGKLAVAHVVMNRSLDRRFPASICDVTRQQSGDPDGHCQFSWTCDALSDRPTDRTAWQRSVAIAKAVYYGRSIDPTAGAMYFHADFADPAWSHQMEPALRIGHHLFYKPAPAPVRTVPARNALVQNTQQVQPNEVPRLPLRQLAEQIQQAFTPNAELAAQLNLSVHVYSKDKARRLVRINGTKYSEGDQLGHDLRLVAITPRGIVVERGSLQFDVAAR